MCVYIYIPQKKCICIKYLSKTEAMKEAFAPLKICRIRTTLKRVWKVLSIRHLLIPSSNSAARGGNPRGVPVTQTVQYCEYAKSGPSNMVVCEGEKKNNKHLNTFKCFKKTHLSFLKFQKSPQKIKNKTPKHPKQKPAAHFLPPQSLQIECVEHQQQCPGTR